MIDRGYIEDGKYFFYQTDHLGNNRVVADANGTTIQKNHYYPFCMAFADTPLAEQGKQPYKYNGKELDQMHGLNTYDYSARTMDPAISRFVSVDPHAESYYSISPYAYVGNNPINIIDPDGKDWFANNNTGNMIFVKGVNELNNDLADIYNLGDIKQYENLGKDNMFGDKVGWGEDGNILDFAFANIGEHSETFMKVQGYDKAEKVKIEEITSIQGGPEGPGIEFKHDYVEISQIGNSKTSYAKPKDMYKQGHSHGEIKRVAFQVKERKYTYDWTKPYGEPNPTESVFKGGGIDSNLKAGQSTYEILKSLRKVKK